MSTHIVLTQEEREAAAMLVANLDLTNPWVVTIKKHEPNRSLDQNALFHRWCHVIANETGNEMEDVKAALKDRYLQLRPVRVGKMVRMVRPGTASLTKGEMSLFMDRVMAFAATDLSIQLPVPT